MPVSDKVQALITSGLEEVHRSPKYVLGAGLRRAIFLALCPEADVRPVLPEPLFRLNDGAPPEGFRRYAWLALLTARRAHLVVEQFVAETPLTPATKVALSIAALPAEILAAAEQVLKGGMDFEAASDLMGSDFYFGMSGVNYFFTYPVSCAAEAVYDALSMILSGLRLDVRDATWRMVEAHSAIDDNPPGVWSKNYFSIHGINPKFYASYFLDEATVADRKTGYPSIYELPVPIHYNLDIRLREWEWWLTEAIPQAWDMGEA